MATEGINVDFWAQQQTLSPPPKRDPRGYASYTGYDTLSFGHWSDFVPAIPLDERYASFKRRLGALLHE